MKFMFLGCTVVTEILLPINTPQRTGRDWRDRVGRDQRQRAPGSDAGARAQSRQQRVRT